MDMDMDTDERSKRCFNDTCTDILNEWMNERCNSAMDLDEGWDGMGCSGTVSSDNSAE
jgi:hypothetical protein